MARVTDAGRDESSPLLGIVAGIAINQVHGSFAGHALSPWLIVVLLAGVLGAPIFSLLGGIALFASLTLGNPPVVLPIMAYEELTTSTGVAAIPLFTLAGFLLAEGQSSERLLRVFRALVRLGARRDGDRRRHALRVLHAVHRWIWRHDPGARRVCCCRRWRQAAIASGSRSACSPRPARSACSSRSRCR